MIFYMLEDLNSGKFYKRGSVGGQWVPKEFASVWTTKAGPSACLGNISRYNAMLARRPRPDRLPREPEIRTIDTDEAMSLLREFENWGLDTLICGGWHSDEVMNRWAGFVARIRRVIG